jgi:hypothetical protein
LRSSHKPLHAILYRFCDVAVAAPCRTPGGVGKPADQRESDIYAADLSGLRRSTVYREKFSLLASLARRSRTKEKTAGAAGASPSATHRARTAFEPLLRISPAINDSAGAARLASREDGPQ